ncbi:hypothetical protein HQ571_04240 [Candidatus Kuenenbacteria bacterium]|nr:hypothetical protein [Candidatus Kuenenbacteria bacterium]
MKKMGNESTDDARKSSSDVKVFGNPDVWRLLCKASSQEQGWMKSTKVMEIKDKGCLVQVSTQQGDNVAEAVTFVVGATFADFGLID